MNKKVIYGGICAATLVFTAAISVISCSNEDEYYAGGNYTLAKQRVTRGVEPGGPSGPSNKPSKDSTKESLTLYKSFTNEEVICTWCGDPSIGVKAVVVSGNVYKDTLGRYTGKITSAKVDIDVMTGPYADISNITANGASISAGFTTRLGYGYIGSKQIVFK